MANTQRAREGFHNFLAGEVIADIAKTARRLKSGFGAVGNDSTSFLSAVL